MSNIEALFARAEKFVPWLQAGDPAAEAVVAELRSRGVSPADPLPAIRRLAAEGNAPCIALLREMETPPPWADFERMRAGGELGHRNFLILAIALVHGALLTTFANPDTARILGGTNRLEQNVVRRLNESTTLFFGVLDTEALRPGGRAWETCLQVRLLHAMVRMRLLASGEMQNLTGIPVNQLHTAGGPLIFGTRTLRALKKLGAHISAEQEVGHQLVWRYVTHLLGVPQALLGNTAEEQEEINDLIASVAFMPNDDSRRLTAALLDGLTHLPQTKYIARATHETLARHLLGDEMADGLGIARHPLRARLLDGFVAMLWCGGWLLRIPAIARATEAIGRRQVEQMVRDGFAAAAAPHSSVPSGTTSHKATPGNPH